MAAAPAVRLLAFLAFGVFMWLLWQIFRTPTAYHLPKATKPFDMTREPNLDRTVTVALSQRLY